MHLTAAFLVLSLKDDEFYCPALIGDSFEGSFDRLKVRKYFTWFLDNRRVSLLQRRSKESEEQWQRRISLKFPGRELVFELLKPQKQVLQNRRSYLCWSGYLLKLLAKDALCKAAVFLEVVALLDDDESYDLETLSLLLHNRDHTWAEDKWRLELKRFFKYVCGDPRDSLSGLFLKNLIPSLDRVEWVEYLPPVPEVESLPFIDKPDNDSTLGISIEKNSRFIFFRYLLGAAASVLLFLFTYLIVNEPVKDSVSPKVSFYSGYQDVGQIGLFPPAVRVFPKENQGKRQQDPLYLSIRRIPLPEVFTDTLAAGEESRFDPLAP